MISQKRIALSILLLLILTGCWDRKELNDQAIILAWGFDINEDGTYRGTAQFAIPSKLGSDSTSSQSGAFFTVSGYGKNMFETTKDMQLKVSRSWFAGQRRVVLIGEKLAKQGLSKVLDELSRDPIVRLRTDIFVLKDATVHDFLQLSYPLEVVSSNALVKMHQAAGLDPDLTLRDFLMADVSIESCPVLPVIKKGSSSEKESGEPDMKLWGFAIFNKESRLVKYLPMKESYIRQWIIGQLESNIFTVNIPGEKENIVIETYHLKSKIHTSQQGDKVRIYVTLSGVGKIHENNTQLDLANSKNMMLVQSELNTQISSFAQEVTRKVQTLGTDIFGFGEAFHRQHPYAWKGIKENWGDSFAKAEVSFTLNVQVREEGLSSLSSNVRENKGKK